MVVGPSYWFGLLAWRVSDLQALDQVCNALRAQLADMELQVHFALVTFYF